MPKQEFQRFDIGLDQARRDDSSRLTEYAATATLREWGEICILNCFIQSFDFAFEQIYIYIFQVFHFTVSGRPLAGKLTVERNIWDA